MRVNLRDVTIQIQTAGEQVYLQVGQWIDHSVTVIKGSSPYLQSTFNASLAVVILNIGLLEIAIRISRLVHKIVDYFCPYQNSTDVGKGVRKLVLGSVIVLTIGSGNHRFCKWLRIPLSVWNIVGIGLLTDVCYLWWKSAK